MALTTVAGVVSGLMPPSRHVKSGLTGAGVGRIISSWTTGGWPAAGGIGSGTPGNSLTAPVAGQIDFLNPASGETVLARMQMMAQAQAGDFMLVDRLWHMSGISPTVVSPTAQTVNSSAWPARDINQSSNGAGVYIALQVTTGTGAGTPSLSMTYTNSAGTAGRIGANLATTVASSGVGNTYVMGLAAGDVGVRSVADFTLSATWTSGALTLMAFRPIVLVPGGPATGGPIKLRKRIEDAITMAAPRIWNGSVLELWFLPSGTSSPTLTGSIGVAQG